MFKQIIVSGIIVIVMTAAASASYVTDFESNDNAGYVIGETVHGVDGWYVPGDWDKTPGSAEIVDSPVASGSQALYFRRYDTSRGARLARQFDGIADDKVIVSLSMGWGRTGMLEKVANRLYFGDSSTTVNPSNAEVIVGFKYVEDNGDMPVYFHYYNGNQEVCVDIASPNKNELYNVMAVIDMVAKTYDLTITGSNLDVTIEDVSFRNGEASEINTMMMLSNVRDTWTVVDNLSVVPEPGSLSLLSTGVVSMFLRRRNK